MTLREINLIPTEVLRRRYDRAHLVFWIACLVGVLLLVSGYFLYQTRFSLARVWRPASLEQIQVELAQLRADLERDRTELERLGGQEKELGRIDRNQPYTVVLVRLADMMNAETWLSSLNIERDPDQEETRLVLRGYANNNDRLADFINRMNAEPLFGDVEVRYVTEVSLGRQEAQPVRVAQFELGCLLQGM